MICSLQPRFVEHIHTVISTCFQDDSLLVATSGVMCSLPLDFWVKTTGKSDFTAGNMSLVPVLPAGAARNAIALRMLLLSSITRDFSKLWSSQFREEWAWDTWARNDSRLSDRIFLELRRGWARDFALRTPLECRQALVEIDVLVAMSLRLTVEELCAIYRIQFPVLKQNEDDTWYDQNGRIIFTCSKGLPGVGLTRHEWNEAKSMTSGSIEQWVTCDIMPDYREAHAHIRLPDGTELDCPCPDYPEPIPGPVERLITYIPPFDRCDREADYRTAWAEFKKRGL